MRTFRFTRLPGMTAALATVLILGACGGDQPTEPAVEAPAAFNAGDVAFLQSMIPHHFQAIGMAQLVDERAAHPELEELAAGIISEQASEIETMRGLLAQAGAESSGGGMGGMDQGGMQMPGMMSDQEMGALHGQRGEAFDLKFIQMMTAHHRGAIEMAEQVLDEGENPQVGDLARRIIDAQRAEIEQLQAWQQQWTG